jgi:large subunit ribosomal protein L1
MAKLSKRMRVIREKVDGTKEYSINEAIALLKELATAKFVESVDVAVNLGIDARKSDQNVRGATVLPPKLPVLNWLVWMTWPIWSRKAR